MLTTLSQIDPQITEQFQPVLDALPAPALVGLGALMVLGLVLWIMGRTLAKAACIISGLLLGAVAGLAVGQVLAEEGAWTLPLILGGGIGGALLAALLFRLWMGATAALIFALLVPAAVLSWQQTLAAGEEGDPEVEAVEEGEASTTLDAIRASVAAADAEDGEAAAGNEDAPPQPWVWQRLQRYYNAVVDTAQQRWSELPESLRFVLLAAAGTGAVAGLIFGLVAPNLAASGLSALLGSILLFYPGRAMAAALVPEQAGWLPWSPGPTFMVIGLLTAIGCVLQWTLFRKRTDK